MTPTSKINSCLNCGTPFPDESYQTKEVFCQSCGQSSRDSRLSIIILMKDAISNILNLDSRLVHTFRDIIYPSKLTSTYIEGKRKYYVNPARLFIFLLIGLITMLLYTIKLENQNFAIDKFYGNAEKSFLLDKYNDIVDSIGTKESALVTDSVKAVLFKKVKSSKIDTIGNEWPDLYGLQRSIKSYGISSYDAVHLSHEEIVEKYNVESFWDKMNVGQYLKIRTNPAGGISFMIKNATWALFFTVLIMGILMKIIYIRSNYYLVEHAVLILNSHSLFFLVTMICLSTMAFFKLKSDYFGISFGLSLVGMIVIQYITLKKYYKQGFFKTLVKQFIINFAYIFIFFLSALFVALISVFLY